MDYLAICQKILETDELIELAIKYNLEQALERLYAKREYYAQKLARLY